MEANFASKNPQPTSISHTIRCVNIPTEFFVDKNIAKRYFRRFGKVKLISFKHKRQSCCVEYFSEEGMLNALDIAGEYNGKMFKVYRKASPTKKKPTEQELDPDWLPDPEVRAEVEAMGGSLEFQKQYNLRPQHMEVEQIEPPKIEANRTPKLKWGRKIAEKSSKSKKSSSTVSNSSLSSTIELIKIIKMQAQSIEDKYRILDARDKLIRLHLKNMDMSKKATIGTCPDMCPEKERLMREVQHQVALYEQEEGSREMNPKLAIKQYSRSSADQEAPLPHELRPVGVLQMTMGYLMHQIMDLCDNTDVNIAEWYHFLWDRTRGIRKDITQQELCCQGSVELVEQCARFHIHCSARLVAEDPSVFDHKINTENLTKCLQTLKYMYHDLEIKGVSCRNEAEFRAYIILLNLNDGNFMWEVQQLRNNIQKSAQVRFALDVYSALEKNNYVKFFKLVKSTDYLNACILMRYFVQVRLSALKRYLKCYSPRISQSLLPLSTFSELLAFENFDSAVEFVETHGLDLNEERTHIILNRNAFTMPEYPFIMDRSIKVVESKKILTVGQVVCGNSNLPPKLFESHNPENSFDIRGFLIKSNKYVTLIENDDKEIVETAEQIKVEPIENKIDDYPIFYQSKPVLVEKSTSDIFEIVPPIREKSPIPEQPSINIELKRQLELAEIRRVEECAKEKQRRLEELLELKRKHQQQLLLIEMERAKKQKELEKKLEDERKKREQLKLQQKIREMELEKQTNEIKIGVNQVIESLIDGVEKQLDSEKLIDLAQKVKNRICRKVVNRWRDRVSLNRRKRKRFDPIFSSRSLNEEARELQTSSQKIVLEQIQRYKLGFCINLNPIKPKFVDKINYFDIIKHFYDKFKLQSEIFWKVTISLPGQSEMARGLNRLNETIMDYLNFKPDENNLIKQIHVNRNQSVTICLEKQLGFVSNRKGDSNGFVFFADDFNDNLRRRIAGNLKNFGLFIKVPIVVVLQKYDENKSKLKLLLNEGIVSDYIILVDNFTKSNLTTLLKESLDFLSTKTTTAPPLELDALQSFITRHLCSDLWKKINSFAKWNENYKECLKKPDLVINLYNDALLRLTKLILDKSNAEYLKFPQIFKSLLRNEIPDYLPCDYKHFPNFCFHPSYLTHIEKVLINLKLPKFVENWPPENRPNLNCVMLNYCRNYKNSRKLYYRLMSVILKDCETNAHAWKSISWSDLIEILAKEKLQEVDFSLYGTGFVNKSIFNQLVVVYNEISLQKFNNSDWFYVNHPLVKFMIDELLKKPKENADFHRQVDNFHIDFDLDGALMKLDAEFGNEENLNKMKKQLEECSFLVKDLEESMAVHRKIARTSEIFMKNLLNK